MIRRGGESSSPWSLRLDAEILEALAEDMDCLGDRDVGHVYPAETWPEDVTEALRQALQQAAYDLRMHAADLEERQAGY